METIEIVITIVVVAIIVLFSYSSSKNKMRALQRRVSPYSSYQRIKSGSGAVTRKRRGLFQIVVSRQLPDDIKEIVRKELKVGDEMNLLPDPDDEYDKTAIKVMFKGKHIGWFPKDHHRKNEIFELLSKGGEVKVICIANESPQNSAVATNPESLTERSDENMMTQFIEGKFIYRQ